MTVHNGPGRFVLFGHPVSHSWSPFIHAMFARQFDHVVDYKLRDVSPVEFRHAVINFFVEGGGGANVTLPHKPAAAEIVNDLSARAERARADAQNGREKMVVVPPSDGNEQYPVVPAQPRPDERQLLPRADEIFNHRGVCRLSGL